MPKKLCSKNRPPRRQAPLRLGGAQEVGPSPACLLPSSFQNTRANNTLEPKKSSRNVEVGEFHEENFLSDQETKEEKDKKYDFNSDGERVLQGCGEEELETISMYFRDLNVYLPLSIIQY